MYSEADVQNMKLRIKTCSKKIIECVALYLILFFCLLAILHSLPLALDDYGFLQRDFSSSKDALLFVLRFGNGRFFGNGGIIFLMHHLIIRDLVRAGVLAGIAFVFPKTLGIKGRVSSFLLLFLILTISPGIFGQTISWMSGFQNYVPPLFILLCTVCLIKRENVGRRATIICRYILIFICSVCMQLYIEHSSCLNVLTAFFLIVFSRFQKKEKPIASVIMLIGTLLGLVMMFLATFMAPQIHGGVQTYLSDGLFALIKETARNAVVLLGMYTENAVSLVILAGLIVTHIWRSGKGLSCRKKQAISSGLFIPGCFFVAIIISGLRPWYGKLAIAESFVLVVMILWYAVTAIISLFLLYNTTKKVCFLRAGILLCAAVISVIPVLFVSPTGYRCLFHSCLMLFGAVLLLTDELYAGLSSEQLKRIFRTSVLIITVVAVLGVGTIFHDIRRMVRIRDDYLEQMAQTGAETAAYFTIPSPYIHDQWNEDYPHFRIIDGHRVQLKILPADVWFRMYYYHY